MTNEQIQKPNKFVSIIKITLTGLFAVFLSVMAFQITTSLSKSFDESSDTLSESRAVMLKIRALKIESVEYKYFGEQYEACFGYLFTSHQECIVRVKSLADLKGYESAYKSWLKDSGLI